jgi:dipeptidyl aminopeptidase/acylaminoacyl peptidase
MRRCVCWVVLGLALVLAATAVTGCGGSGGSHTTRATTSAGGPSFPSSFVAVSRTKSSPGVTLYSSSTGRTMRHLTDGARDIDPMLAQDGRSVFFVRVPMKVCPVQLYRVPATGGPATRLTTAGFPGGPVGVSPDGRMLAYTGTPPGTCRLTHPNNWLVLRNLQTGQVHRIHSLVWGVAWAPGDHTLAVVVPDPSTGRGEIRLISDPFRATPAQVKAAPSIPCPDRRACAETSPSFDGAGTLSYTAMISPDGERCWLSHCTGWTYALVTHRGTRNQVSVSQRLRTDAVLPQSIVSANGRAFLYTLPSGSAGARIWHWSSQGATPVAKPGGIAIQAVWR